MFNAPDIRIKQIIHSLPDAIVVADHLGRVKFLNPAAESTLSYTLSEAVDRPLSDIVCLVDENTDEALSCIGTKAMASAQEENAGSNALLIGRDGLSELPVEVIATPLKTAQEINGVLITIHDVRLARFSRKQLSWNASHDSLTGVYNRYEFDQQCHRLLLTAKRDRSQHALLLIDIDHFRQLNELAGNHFGDELLMQVAQLLKSLLRANDQLSRNHADQFLILLSHCQIDRAEQIADNLRQQIEQISLDIEHGNWPATCSVGITAIDENSPDSVIELLHQVESATYRAKKAGRNSCMTFNDEFYRHFNRELLALQNAMHNNNFQLYYQTIESPQGLAPVCEILLRYRNETGQEQEPAEFLPLFEKSGLIVQLDLWVVQNLLEKLVDHPQLMVSFARIHVNLSAYSFASQYFLDSVEALLMNTALPYGLLCFEVSESSIMSNLGHTDKVMNRLVKLGCLFAVDDVDADLSAFERLAKLPISIAKIDGKLIQAIKNSAYGVILVKAIHEMAKEADMQTIAQQVEDFFIYDWLQHHEIDYVQGFILHAPRMLDELAHE
ncbi:MAG: EAL domain-containing protein [Gammaproteobacteria bacterium]|nr:EAL domain-containing protein [Gammaproteobacteria bacterium]